MTGNFLAILLAAVASFMLGWAWYGTLGKQWMAAQGKTEAEIKASGRPLPLLMAMSLFGALVMAYALSAIIAMSADPSIWASLRLAFLVWLGFVAATMVVNHGYQGAKPELTLIDSGHWLAVLLVQGLILGWMR